MANIRYACHFCLYFMHLFVTDLLKVVGQDLSYICMFIVDCICTAVSCIDHISISALATAFAVLQGNKLEVCCVELW